MQVPLPRRLSWPCVSDLHTIYKAESWQRAVTLDDSTPQCRLCEVQVWRIQPLYCVRVIIVRLNMRSKPKSFVQN